MEQSVKDWLKLSCSFYELPQTQSRLLSANLLASCNLIMKLVESKSTQDFCIKEYQSLFYMMEWLEDNLKAEEDFLENNNNNNKKQIFIREKILQTLILIVSVKEPVVFEKKIDLAREKVIALLKEPSFVIPSRNRNKSSCTFCTSCTFLYNWFSESMKKTQTQ